MPEDQEIWRGVDHAERSWIVTTRPFHFNTQLVNFVCRSKRGTKQLDQTGAWHPDTDWDMTRWFPASPRPVPSLVLAKVMSALKGEASDWPSFLRVDSDQALEIQELIQQAPGKIESLPATPPAPPAPLEGEVGELVEFLLTYGDHVMDEYGDVGEHEQLTRAATLLEQLSAAAPAAVPSIPLEPLHIAAAGIRYGYMAGHNDTVEACYGDPDEFAADHAPEILGELEDAPAVVPVAVSERPWEREGWCDLDGECWWCPPDGPPYWSMVNPAMVYGGSVLPAHAIPLPAPQGEEVEA